MPPQPLEKREREREREREIQLGGHCFCTSPSYYWVETTYIEERGRGLERERG